jgi:hypothetical protein
MRQIALAALATLIASLHLSVALAQPVTINNFGDWTAYRYTDSSGQLTCFAATTPTRSEGNYTRRGDIWLQVTHRPNDSENINRKNVTSFEAGYPFADGWRPRVTIGNQVFAMFTIGETAWAWAADDDSMVGAMKAGASLIIEGRSQRGTYTRDTFSLIGVTAAINAIDEACGL